MLGRTKQLNLPRRVVVYYLLFCLFPLVWMMVSTVIVSSAVLNAQHEGEILAFLGNASSVVTRELSKTSPGQLQSIVERFRRDKSLQYAAITSKEGSFLAHTYHGRIGKTYQRPDGDGLNWGEFTGTRFGQAGNRTREYSAPLWIRDEPAGALLVAVAEPSLWTTLVLVAAYAPLTLFGPLVLIVTGAVIMNGLVRPLSHIESQLRLTAVAATLGDVNLQPIQARSPAALGWNRFIAEFQSANKGGDLDKRLTEAVQSRRAERADEVLNSLSDGIAVTDQHGRVTFANQPLSVLVGNDANPDSLRGRVIEQVLELSHQDGMDSSPLLDPALRPRPVSDELKRHQGNIEKVLRISRAPIRGNDRGVKPGHVWTVRDITQQKLSEKMRDQFLSSATHEIRTPLANIKAYAETLSLTEEIDIESQKEFLNIINTEVTRLARFIDDLLSISSMEAGAMALDRQDCDLERLFRDIAGKVKGQMDQKSIEFTMLFPEKWPQLKIDKDKFTVAIVNLLSNAAKYTPLKGRVAMKVKIVDGSLVIDIQDTGIGISAEELPRVFDKFFRSQAEEVQRITGTGIGLSMAQEVIHLHDGELSVQSELGKGTTFTVTVPLKA
jgi:PAS domain S-box-containing protein